MSIWALADLHLAIGNPSKTMEVFGGRWKNYHEKIQTAWLKNVQPDDLVLIPGDISWAFHLEQALIDLAWLDQLPGQKLLLKGNHDSWWPSSKKLKASLPQSIHFIHNSVYNFNNYTFGGARLWDTFEYSGDAIVDFTFNPFQKQPQEEETHKEKIFCNELARLRLSLEQLNPKARYRVALTHYPPIGVDLAPSRASKILEEFKIDVCVFGHWHNVHQDKTEFGVARGVRYVFTAADALDFTPVKIFD